ncbi:MAG: hypothetical protein ACHQJ7_05235, partial [Vicinamibacteria bacterium]
MTPKPFPSLGVTVMPEWFQCEGVDAVLDRVAALGATAIATSPYVLEVAPDGEGGREPPPDGEAGRVRPLDRPLFGRTELWVRTAPAFEHDPRRYYGLRYQPPPATALTRLYAGLLDRVIDAARARGIEVLLQVMAACPPGYRVQFSGLADEDRCLGPDGAPHEARVDRNGSLASPHVVAYVATLCAELAERYPGVAGFRLDWPEAPPYDFQSVLFDFHPAMQVLMREAGLVRPLDRRLFGRTELWVRTAPAFEHDPRRYHGLRYQPSPATTLTRTNAGLLDRVIDAARARGIEVLLQVMAACPPGYRVQFSG